MARKLVVRKWFALEENFGDPRARPEGDLRGREVGGAEGDASNALEVDVDALPALSELERKKSTIPSHICDAPVVADGRIQQCSFSNDKGTSAQISC